MEAFWVFGYGSLMWRPGFEYQEAQRAHIVGFHRSLCIYSHHHRGTKEKPGLVMGLNPGGSCCGMAFYVDKEHAENAYHYLVKREQVNGTYKEQHVELELADKRRVKALVFATDIHHPQFAGNLTALKIASIVETAHGVAGPNQDYLKNTVSMLQEMDIHEEKLEQVLGFLPKR